MYGVINGQTINGSGVDAQSGAVSGFSDTTIGSPTTSSVCAAATIEPATEIPRAYFAFNQWLFANPNPPRTLFGLGYGILPILTSTQNLTGGGVGFRPTSFGVASASGEGTYPATGFGVGNYGTPKVTIRQAVVGLSATQLGGPNAVGAGRVSGWRPTVFGAPFGSGVRVASTIAPRTRFGVPRTSRPNVYEARTVRLTRFGHPSGRKFFGQQTQGWQSSVLGDPTGFSVHKSLSVPTSCRMGRPKVVRSPLC